MILLASAVVGFFGAGSLAGAGGLSLVNCIYFSAETFTSLGFGDIVPVGSVRMMAGAETLNGLLPIGWSASYACIAIFVGGLAAAAGALAGSTPALLARRVADDE